MRTRGQTKTNPARLKALPWPLAVAIVVTALAAPLMAHAQNDDNRTDLSINEAQSLSDLTEARARAPTGAGFQVLDVWSPPPLAPGKDVFWGAVDFATTLNTNPPAAAGGAKDSAQFNTKLQLNYHRQFEGVKFRWAGTVEIDRYDAFSRANQDNVINTLRLDFNGVRKAEDKAKPVFGYVAYTPTIKQTGDFEDHKGTQHDLGGGVVMSNPFDVGGPWKAQVEGELTRRLSNQSGNSISGIAKLKINYKVNDRLFWKFEPNLRYRVFDEAAGVRRKDTSLIVPFALSWDPEWLAASRSQLVFNVTASKTWSNVASKRFTQWNIGPTVQLVQPF